MSTRTVFSFYLNLHIIL